MRMLSITMSQQVGCSGITGLFSTHTQLSTEMGETGNLNRLASNETELESPNKKGQKPGGFTVKSYQFKEKSSPL